MADAHEAAAQVEALKRLHGPDPMAEHREWIEEYDRALAEEEARRSRPRGDE